MILGIGVDVCSLERLERALERSPRLRERLFTAQEAALPLPSLAGRMAVKEAVAKALSCSTMSWHDCWVERAPGAAPQLVTTGTVQRRAQELGVRSWHVSISHDHGLAIAMVVAEG